MKPTSRQRAQKVMELTQDRIRTRLEMNQLRRRMAELESCGKEKVSFNLHHLAGLSRSKGKTNARQPRKTHER